MELKQTPLYQRHVDLGARIVDFGGWAMPVQYEGILAEHHACRQRAALFDVSHMGEFRLAGPDATTFLDRLLTNNIATLPVGRCRYSLMCQPDGGIVDDLIVSNEGDDTYLLVVNAANIGADWDWISAQLADAAVKLTDESPRWSLLAVQGPASPQALEALLPAAERESFAELRFYRFGWFHLAGHRVIVSRTGYTGERGYEILLANDLAGELWDHLLADTPEVGLVPAGLGARDTLRLEAGLCLHGHDISPAHDPLSAGLARFVDLTKPEFVGREALAALAASGPARQLVGLLAEGKGVVREGCPILADGLPVGTLTSGTFAPTLQAAIGLGYVPAEWAAPGTSLAVEVRGRAVPCRVVELPFYRPT